MLDKTAGPTQSLPHERRKDLDSGADQSPGIRGLIGILSRRRLPLVACSVLIPALALLALRHVTPLYTATGTLIYEPGRFRAHELQSILQPDPTTEAVMASQAEILRGLRVIEPMAHRLGLFSNPAFNVTMRPPGMLGRLLRRWRERGPSPPDRPATGPPSSGPPTQSPRNEVLLAAQRATSVHTVNASHVLEVSFTAPDPVLAAAAVNSLMDIYIKAQLGAKFNAVNKARSWLERRAGELRAEVRAQEDRIAAYRADHGLVRGVHADLDVENVSQLTESVAKARADLASVEGRMNASRHRSGASGEAAVAPSVVRLREQSGAMTAELRALTTRLGPNHPDVVALRRQIQQVQGDEAAETARVVAATDAEVRAARDRLSALERDLAAAQARVDRGAMAQIPLNAMQRDADASRALLASVLERMQETAQQAAVEVPDAHEVSLALPPGAPSSPRTASILAAAAASGALLGLFLVYLLELADTSLASGEAVRARLGLPCFALIPEVGRRTLGRLRVEDYAALRPLGGFAEQVRGLRAGLWLGAARPRLVAVTAARPGEGKTTVALALGRVAALSGERVALLDCDLRRPALARLLGAEGEIGLTEVLAGEASAEAVLRKDPLTPLAYIPAGAAGAGAAGLFMSEAMVRLLQALREQYDLVLMDAPPALAIADTRLIAQLADATLFCARWRRTPREVARNAIELLEEAQASVVGVALTRVDARVHLRSGYPDAEACGIRVGAYFRS